MSTMTAETLYAVTRDGKTVAGPFDDDFAAAGWLLHNQPQSVAWATKHEGYAIVAIEPWGEDEAKRHAAIARQVMYRDEFHNARHYGENDPLTRANCGPCVLSGYADPDDTEHDPNDGPNYAGWARLYVQANRPIPERWREAFHRELHVADNPSYSVALARDIATYGVTFG